MEIKPLEGYILIQPVEQKEKTDSGIILAPGKEDKDNTSQGTVLEVGDAKSARVKKGDFILFTKYGPSEVEVDGKLLVIARPDDILAIIKK